MRLIAMLLGALAPAAPIALAAQVRPPCPPGETVDRRCPSSPVYNRRGVDIQPDRPSGSPFQSPFGNQGSSNGLTDQQRRIQQRNQGN